MVQKFRCPVCRAVQTPQSECRRCKADLSLTLRARQRLAYLREQHALAIQTGDAAHQQRIIGELKVLAPQNVTQWEAADESE